MRLVSEAIYFSFSPLQFVYILKRLIDWGCLAPKVRNTKPEHSIAGITVGCRVRFWKRSRNSSLMIHVCIYWIKRSIMDSWFIRLVFATGRFGPHAPHPGALSASYKNKRTMNKTSPFWRCGSWEILNDRMCFARSFHWWHCHLLWPS